MGVEEAQHQPVGPDLAVGGDQPLQPDGLAAVGAEALAQPQHHPQRTAGGPAHLTDQGRLRRPRVLLGPGQQGEPVRPAGLGPLGVGRVPDDDLEQAGHVGAVLDAEPATLAHGSSASIVATDG